MVLTSPNHYLWVSYKDKELTWSNHSKSDLLSREGAAPCTDNKQTYNIAIAVLLVRGEGHKDPFLYGR